MSRPPRHRAYRALLLLGAALTTAALVLTACTHP
ncbi:hypothetical protein SsS58_04486 [Streptomyces scabiei]|uniref:Lipoprotein n=1 Tax=Streptomyces scabiei TaxID=1930 RepID=A0A100JR52_STRSC|nr:hypothetical protein SsS58_04486 [Streptomyces scabiei]